jgi:hypothetical protein
MQAQGYLPEGELSAVRWRCDGSSVYNEYEAAMSGIDTSVLRTFSIHNDHGECSIVDTRQFRVIPGRVSAAVNYTCAGVKKVQGGLLFVACGQNGNIAV